MIDLRTSQLRAFVTVADRRHFGQAARELGLAQSAVSQQIRRLENTIGAPLLTRTSRRVELTPAGSALHDAARRILRDIERSIAHTRATAAGQAGTLIVGAQAAARATLAPAAIALLAARGPDLRVDLRITTSAEAAAGLLDGSLDAALVRDLERQDGVLLETVATEPVLVALPAGHRLADAPQVDLADLAQEPFISWSRAGAPVFHDRLTAACRAAGFIPRVNYEMRGIDARLGLVAAGLGVALEPASYALLHREGVHFLPLTGEPIHATIQTAVPALRQAPGLPAFLQAVRDAAH